MGVGYLTGQGGGGSNIKSIQTGSLSMTSGSTFDVTISEIDLLSSVATVTVKTSSPTQSAGDIQAIQIEIKNSTTITIKRGATTSTEVTIKWVVIEFNNVKSLQIGDYTLSSSSGYTPISSINKSKSILFFSFYQLLSSRSTAIGSFLTIGEISSIADELLFSNAYEGTKYIHWQVIEFK